MALAPAQPKPRTPENPLAEGLERLPVAPTKLVIFGATGDLARRKLLPAIYNLAHEGALPERFNLVGVSRGEPHEDYRDECGRGDPAVLAHAARRGRARRPARGAALRGGRLRRRGGLRRRSAATLDELDEAAGEPLSRAFYLSTAPGVLPGDRRGARQAGSAAARGADVRGRHREAVRHLARGGARAQRARARRSSTSARSSASTTTSARRPSRTCWRSASPTACSSRSGTATTSTNVQITAAEDIGIGGRAGYYDHAGALRDLVQNHMLQLPDAARAWSRR